MRAHSIESRWWVSPSSAKRAKSSAYRIPNPLPSPDAGARPARSQSQQSDAGAAPSHWVDDAPVPHMNPSGHRMADQYCRIRIRIRRDAPRGRRLPGALTPRTRSLTMGEAIRVEDDGAVRQLVLCRPEELNTITVTLRDELDAALDEA